MTALPSRREVLLDCSSVLQRGWAVAPERPWSEEWEGWLRHWAEALDVSARVDGLSVTCSVGWDAQIDGVYSATVQLNWPGGAPCDTFNMTSLPARLEQAWGAKLSCAANRSRSVSANADADRSGLNQKDEGGAVRGER